MGGHEGVLGHCMSQQCAVAVSGLAVDHNWGALGALSSTWRQPGLHCCICLASPHPYKCLLAIAYDLHGISGPWSHAKPTKTLSPVSRSSPFTIWAIPMPQGLCPGTAEVNLS